MLTNEKIAHDLALLWVNNAVAGNVPKNTDGNSLVEEYLAAFTDALTKLNELRPESKA